MSPILIEKLFNIIIFPIVHLKKVHLPQIKKKTLFERFFGLENSEFFCYSKDLFTRGITTSHLSSFPELP